MPGFGTFGRFNMPTAPTVTTAGLDRLLARFRRIVNPDATPLMLTWMKISEEDNRKGVLAGTHKDGNPMQPVTYRPKNAVKLTAAQRNNAKPRATRGQHAGIGT